MNVGMTFELTREDGRVLQVSGGKYPDSRGEEFLEFRLPDQDLSARTVWTPADPSEAGTQSEPRPLRLEVDGTKPREVISRYGLLFDAQTIAEEEPMPLEVEELAPFWDFLKDIDVNDQNFATTPPISLFGLKDWAGCVGGFTGAGAGIGGGAGFVGSGGNAAGAAAGGAIGGAFGGFFGVGYCTAEQVMK